MIVLGSNVVVKETEAKKETESGIILSTDMTTGHKPALVVATGDACKYVAPGVVVFLDWKNAMPIEHDGVKLAVVEEEKIKVIIE
jgi:co-chaperonin GroES (HSP10)